MSGRTLLRNTLCIGLLLVAAAPARAAVRLAALFSDGMVLQRDRQIPVWGWADPQESVTVALGANSVKTKAGEDGRWSVKLPVMSAGGPHTLVATGSNEVTVSDVLIGEVWVCSGQSNMNMPIDWGVFGKWGSPESEKGLAEADYPKIRMFLVDKKMAGEPAADVSGQWQICRNRAILKWSAVGYFFGRELHQKLGVPVGLIKTAVGGTPIESWMSRESLVAAVPELAKTVEYWDKKVADYDPAEHQKKLAAWQEAAAKAKAAGKRPPGKPVKVAEDAWRPCSLYCGMVRPLMPYGIRGVIWYQGESNARNAMQYGKTFPAMIRSWRQQWQQDEFPFLFVQLANFRARRARPSDSAWAELREAQMMALSEPKTAMAVTIDIGEAKDIHPKNKLDVGRRLALGAMKIAYGRAVVHSGPLFASMKIEGQKARLQFKHIGGGLVAKGGGPLKGFAIAGEGRKYVWAQARIDGDTLVVWSDQVNKPVAVRYAWADNPECNLYNTDGLPASPFRTDDWPRAAGAAK